MGSEHFKSESRNLAGKFLHKIRIRFDYDDSSAVPPFDPATNATRMTRKFPELFVANRIKGFVCFIGLPAYSDSVGTTKKCRCMQRASYCVTVSKHCYCIKVQFRAQKSVTVRGDLLTVALKPVSL